MAATDDLNNLLADNKEFTSALMFIEHLTALTDKVYWADAELQALFDAGDFENLPLGVKATLTAWWAVVQNARDVINANQAILDLYAWRP